MKPVSDQFRFIELRSEGYSLRKISNLMGISKDTCLNWNKLLSKEINEIIESRYEELTQKYLLSNASRIMEFGIVISRLKEEISKRDFSSLESFDLLELQRKYLLSLSKETSKLAIKSESSSKDENILNQLINDSGSPTNTIRIEVVDATNEPRIAHLENQIKEELIKVL